MEESTTIAPLLVTAKSAADMLSISERKFWELVSCGHIPRVRIGRSVRFSVASLEKHISQLETYK